MGWAGLSPARSQTPCPLLCFCATHSGLHGFLDVLRGCFGGRGPFPVSTKPQQRSLAILLKHKPFQNMHYSPTKTVCLPSMSSSFVKRLAVAVLAHATFCLVGLPSNFLRLGQEPICPSCASRAPCACLHHSTFISHDVK